MPLPAYLLERLKKRNVIQHDVDDSGSRSHDSKNNSKQTTKSSYQQDNETNIREEKIDEEQEEIIAEDYSDEIESDNQNFDHEEIHDRLSDDKQINDIQKDGSNYKDIENINSNSNTPSLAVCQKDEKNPTDNDVEDEDDTINNDKSSKPSYLLNGSQSVLGCPNKYNIYHHCSQYCLDNHNKLESTSPTMEQRKQLALLLKTYPISNEWTVVFDPGVKTFYFWNIITNLVSWLPPGMNGLISLSADQIRRSMSNQLELQQQDTNECLE